MAAALAVQVCPLISQVRQIVSDNIATITIISIICIESRLVFKPSTDGKGASELTRDATFVCRLLAIEPNDLLYRSYESFAEKGLTEGR